MVIEESDDEQGHDLLLGGVIHRLEFSVADNGDERDKIFMHHWGNGSAFLDQDDVNALHKYLSRYVKE